MYSKFFYELAIKQFEFAYTSFKNTGSSINDLMKTLFTLVTLIIGYIHYLLENDFTSPLTLGYISLGFFMLVVVIGFIPNIPRKVVYLNSKQIYDRYYEVDLTEDVFDLNVASIVATLSEDTDDLNDLANYKAKYLFVMQLGTVFGIICLCFSLLNSIL